MSIDKQRIREFGTGAMVELLAELERIEAERDALKAALTTYGVHNHSCEYSYGASEHCTCGFSAVLSEGESR